MYHSGEYLVLQTYPMNRKLKVVMRTFNYQEARRDCELENLAHDYSHYSLRIYHDAKLWDLNSDGKPDELSEEQFWEVHPDYEQAARDENAEGDIEVHHCTYLYYAVPMTRISACGEAVVYTGAITCLKDDHGRVLRECPNCTGMLVDWFEDEEDEEETSSVPSSCQGCTNYHGHYYGGKILICGIHPYGWDSDNCPDYQTNFTEEPTEISLSSAIVCQSENEQSFEPVLTTTDLTFVTIRIEPSQKVISTRDDKILESSQTVPEDVIEERLRQHHSQMRRLRFFARIDSTLSAIAGLCLLGVGIAASATVAAYGMGLMAEGGVKSLQGVKWDNTAKVTTGFGLVALGGTIACGVLAAASSVIDHRTKP